MRFIVIAICFLVFSPQLRSQDLFKKGSIITWSNDTIHGSIRAPLSYKELGRVVFKGNEEQLSYNIYSPLSLKSFYFEGGPYFASVRTRSVENSSLRRRFAYVIAHGEMDLYEVPVYQKGDIKLFHIGRDGRTVFLGEIVLENGKGKIKEGSYISQLRLQTSDCDHEIEIEDDLPYNRKSLKTLIEWFNQSAGYSDLKSNFITRLPRIMTYSAHVGYPFALGFDENITVNYGAEIGFRTDIYQPGLVDALSFQTGLDYLLHNQDLESETYFNHQLIVPALFHYYNKKKPVNPYFRGGPAISYSFSDHTDKDDALHIMWVAEAGINVLEKFKLGLSYRSANHLFNEGHYLSIQLHYIFGRY